jgi:hypothetical protein
VGPEKKRFIVHQDLLTYHSEFFRAALTGKFKEAEEKTVPLPEDSEVIFEFFVHWLYHKEFPTTDNASTELLEQWRNDYENAEGYKGALESKNLIKLHVFADKYGEERLKTATLNGLFIHFTTCISVPSQASVRYAYDNLPEESALLSLLVAIQCCMDGRSWAKLGIDGYPSPFIVSVLERLAKSAQRDLRTLSSVKLCDFHEHKNEEERKVCPHKAVVLN